MNDRLILIQFFNHRIELKEYLNLYPTPRAICEREKEIEDSISCHRVFLLKRIYYQDENFSGYHGSEELGTLTTCRGFLTCI